MERLSELEGAFYCTYLPKYYNKNEIKGVLPGTGENKWIGR